MGEHSAKIEYLYLALEGTEAAEKDSRAQSGELRVAVENLQSELEEISTRYEMLKGEKQRVDAELQSKSRALEALEQEKEDEVKRGGRGSDHEHDGAVILLNVPGSEKFY